MSILESWHKWEQRVFFVLKLDSLLHGRSNRAGQRPVHCVQVLVLQALAVHWLSLITGFAPQCVEKLEKTDKISGKLENTFSHFQLASTKLFCQMYLLGLNCLVQNNVIRRAFFFLQHCYEVKVKDLFF